MQKRGLGLVVGTAVLALVPACGASAPPPAQAPEPAEAAVVRQQPPAPLPARPLEFPGFQEKTLPNGLRMIVVEKREQPLANVNLYVRSGAALDPADKAGLVGITAELLTKGTKTRSAKEISETIEGVGGTLSSGAGNDFVSISSSVLSDQLPLAFELISDVALRPTFPKEELEIARKRTLSALQAALGQAGSVAERQFMSQVYGEHPYGTLMYPRTVQAIGRADLERFHQANFRADNALLVVSGDVDAARVEELAREHLGGWTGGAGPAPAFVAPPARERARIFLVHRPGSVQSNVLIGHTGIRPDEPDFYALQVLNRIVGGGSSSRLFLKLREEKGWTYGPSLSMSRPRDVGHYYVGAEVRNEVTDSAVVEMLDQLRRVREEPVSEEELRAAKGFLVGSFPLRIETSGQVASQVAQTRLLGLPIEHLLEYRERVGAVTAADLQRVAQKHVRPEQAAIVIVGDATKVLPMVEGIAPVTLFDIEGKALQRADLEVKGPSEALNAASLRPWKLTYAFQVQGNAMGTVTSTLAREGETWVGTSVVESPVMSQESVVRFGDDLVPVSSQQKMSQGGMQMESELRLADGRVTGSAKLPPQAGGDKTFDAEVPAGALLPGMDEFVMAAADLAPGKTLTVPSFNAMAGSVTPITYKVTAEESVTVPAGTFPAYRVEVSGGPTPIVVFVRKDKPHIMLRQEFAGAPVTIELRSIDQ